MEQSHVLLLFSQTSTILSKLCVPFLILNGKYSYFNKFHTVKPVLSGYSKIDKTKVLKTNVSLMKVESIAECSVGAFCNAFDLH